MTQPDGHKHRTNWADAAVDIVLILAGAAVLIVCMWR